MTKMNLPPGIAALCGSCETNCVKECCGIEAFSFSPFTIIYHLARAADPMSDDYVAATHSELAGLAHDLGRMDRHAEEVSIPEFNESFTVEQLISLCDLIGEALTEACAIYAIHEKQIEQGYQKFLRIIEAPKMTAVGAKQQAVSGLLRTLDKRCNVQNMIEITLPPRIAALCGSCETLCVSGCCGIRAFSFSPFNIIYHLTKIADPIRHEDVAEIRSQLGEPVRSFRGADQQTAEVIIEDFNEAFTVEQLISLCDLIDAALSEAWAIYAIHEKQIEQGYQKFLRIIEPPE